MDIREALECEIAENKRALNGPMRDDPFWKGRMSGLIFARAILIGHDYIPVDDVMEAAQR